MLNFKGVVLYLLVSKKADRIMFSCGRICLGLNRYVLGPSHENCTKYVVAPSCAVLMELKLFNISED